jgi:uncharacterized NAD(P)/FAD-binding protein YdhS
VCQLAVEGCSVAACDQVAVVMPGHVGTDILANSRRAHGLPEPQDMSDAQIERDFRDKAPLTAAPAATAILDGVRSGAWRILVGEDAKMLAPGCAPTPRPPMTTRRCSAT